MFRRVAPPADLEQQIEQAVTQETISRLRGLFDELFRSLAAGETEASAQNRFLTGIKFLARAKVMALNSKEIRK